MKTLLNYKDIISVESKKYIVIAKEWSSTIAVVSVGWIRWSHEHKKTSYAMPSVG